MQRWMPWTFSDSNTKTGDRKRWSLCRTDLKICAWASSRSLVPWCIKLNGLQLNPATYKWTKPGISCVLLKTSQRSCLGWLFAWIILRGAEDASQLKMCSKAASRPFKAKIGASNPLHVPTRMLDGPPPTRPCKGVGPKQLGQMNSLPACSTRAVYKHSSSGGAQFSSHCAMWWGTLMWYDITELENLEALKPKASGHLHGHQFGHVCYNCSLAWI